MSANILCSTKHVFFFLLQSLKWKKKTRTHDILQLD